MIVCLTSLGDNFSLLQVLKKKKFIWYNENMSTFERQSVFHNEREVSKYTVIIEPPYPPGWRMNPHRHIQCELSLVKSGSCTIQAGESTFRFQTNDVVFIPGGVLHDFYAEPPQGVEFAVVQFLPFEEELLHHLINNPPLGCFSLFDLSASVFLEFCHKLQREIASLLPFAEVQCRAIIEEMVVFLLRAKPSPPNHRSLQNSGSSLKVPSVSCTNTAMISSTSRNYLELLVFHPSISAGSSNSTWASALNSI